MILRRVKLFVVSTERPLHGTPGPAKEFDVEAETLDGLREVVQERLIADGFRVRAISFGPEGLVAYAEETR